MVRSTTLARRDALRALAAFVPVMVLPGVLSGCGQKGPLISPEDLEEKIRQSSDAAKRTKERARE